MFINLFILSYLKNFADKGARFLCYQSIISILYFMGHVIRMVFKLCVYLRDISYRTLHRFGDRRDVLQIKSFEFHTLALYKYILCCFLILLSFFYTVLYELSTHYFVIFESCCIIFYFYFRRFTSIRRHS